MKRIRITGSLVLGSILVMTGCAERNAPTASRDQPGLAFATGASLTSVITDPVGDVASKDPAWQDIVRSQIAERGGTFVFTMELADVVPANPDAASGGAGVRAWLWGLDTDPETFPQGGVFPSGPGRARPFEFFVDLEWDGAQFSGLLYDLRPLLTGGQMVVTAVPFTIHEAEIDLSVAASALGDPSTFAWGAATCARHAHLGSEGFQCLDLSPDNSLATWPE